MQAWGIKKDKSDPPSNWQMGLSGVGVTGEDKTLVSKETEIQSSLSNKYKFKVLLSKYTGLEVKFPELSFSSRSEQISLNFEILLLLPYLQG